MGCPHYPSRREENLFRATPPETSSPTIVTNEPHFSIANHRGAELYISHRGRYIERSMENTQSKRSCGEAHKTPTADFADRPNLPGGWRR
jgi:hypothetical protein